MSVLAATAPCVLLTAALYLCSGNVSAYDMADVKALKTKLFTTDGYDAEIRPIKNQSAQVQVDIVANLYSKICLREFC